MVLNRISFLQCFHPWFLKVHWVHCFLAFRSSISSDKYRCAHQSRPYALLLTEVPLVSLPLFPSFFFAWYTLFSLAVYFGFFTAAAVCSFHFLFPLEADPEESVFFSFLPSWKSSSFRTAVRTASSDSLSSGIGSIMDNRLTASSGI